MLDGAVPPTLTARQLWLRQASGLQDELTRFIADCVTHPDCPLGRNASTAAGKLADFFASTHVHPLPTGTDRMVNEVRATTGVQVAIYGSPKSWPSLRQTLTRAMAGDGHELLELSDQFYRRDTKTGHYSADKLDAFFAISCLDRPGIGSVDDIQAELPEFTQASPLIGAFIAWRDLPCVYWPVRTQSQPHPIHYMGSPPILVVGTTHDVATPHRSAQELADQLGSAIMLTYNGDGHTAYGRGSSCVNNAVDTYLIRGMVPTPGIVCQPDT